MKFLFGAVVWGVGVNASLAIATYPNTVPFGQSIMAIVAMILTMMLADAIWQRRD